MWCSRGQSLVFRPYMVPIPRAWGQSLELSMSARERVGNIPRACVGTVLQETQPHHVFSGTVPRVPAVHGPIPRACVGTVLGALHVRQGEGRQYSSCVRGDSPSRNPASPCARAANPSCVRGDSPSAAPSLVRAWGQSLPTVPPHAGRADLRADADPLPGELHRRHQDRHRRMTPWATSPTASTWSRSTLRR